MDGVRDVAAVAAAPSAAAPRRDPEEVRAQADRLIAGIDRLLTDQVNAILHHPRVQRLEAAWRSLRLLVEVAADGRGTRVRLLHATWAEVSRDLARAIEFDQSTMFARIYSDEFDTPGGTPYGLLIGDYEVHDRREKGARTDDVETLMALAGVSAAAFSPLVVGCAPDMLGVARFSEIGPANDLSGLFAGPERQRWTRLQDMDESRFVGVALPRVLVRAPYADDGSRADGFRFREEVEGPDASAYLWGNAAFAFAVVAMRAFSHHGWLADVRGARLDEEAGGLVTHLPRTDFDTDRPGVALRAPLDVAFTERQEAALSEQGFIPLVRARETPCCVFNNCQSVQRPRAHKGAAGANARLSARLSAILCVSRFAHCVKLLARERIGSAVSPEACRDWLQTWLRGYSMASDDASPEMKARYPLRAASVQVVERPGRVGEYDCILHLQPHFQFEQAVSSFRLSTHIAPGGGA